MATTRLRGCFSGLLAATLALCSSFATASPLAGLSYVFSGTLFAGYGRDEAEFKAELADQASLQGDTSQAVPADLRRDSHGFRQISAFEVPGSTALTC